MTDHRLVTRSSAYELVPASDCRPLAWYALFTRSNHEKKVSAYCAERHLEHFLPLYTVVHHWSNHRHVRVDVPLFPGYLFVRLNRSNRLLALSAPGAISLVGPAGAPTPIPAEDIELLRTGLKTHKYDPHPYVTLGARVRVRSGPLAGMVGVVVRSKNSFRVLLSIDLIQQSVALEIDATELEPIAIRAA